MVNLGVTSTGMTYQPSSDYCTLPGCIHVQILCCVQDGSLEKLMLSFINSTKNIVNCYGYTQF